MESLTVTRKISIDAGHRIATHGSQCRHLHGHRYVIEATCSARNAELHHTGEQTDMVIDFAFLKEEMMRHINTPCDHGFIASSSDTDLLQMFYPKNESFEEWCQSVREAVDGEGFFATTNTQLSTKLYVIEPQPTSECLAAHWFHRLVNPVHKRSEGVAILSRLRVWETPNCYSDYVNPDQQRRADEE